MDGKKRSIIKYSVIIGIFLVIDAVLVFCFFHFELYYLFYAEPLPESGVWECSDLNMEIDFDELTERSRAGHQAKPCVKVFASDGSTTDYDLENMPRGNSISIVGPCKADWEYIVPDTYLEGCYKFSGDELVIRTDSGSYAFVRK